MILFVDKSPKCSNFTPLDMGGLFTPHLWVEKVF
jgi:hypothetical protein